MAMSPLGLRNKGGIGSTRARRPIILGVVGDSAAGKTTLTRGIENIFGQHRVNSVCTDDYHRYDRDARKKVQLTPLNPECNYMDIMEQHLVLMAMGEPVLKPVYNHNHGTLDAPEIFEPADYVVIEGLLGFWTKGMRDCFDVKVFLDPPEDLRRAWKIKRDCTKRNYTPDEVIADMQRREPDSKEFIEPQREYADIVVRFIPPGGNLDSDPTKYNVRLVLRPTLPHPYLAEIGVRQGGPQHEAHVVLGRVAVEVAAGRDEAHDDVGVLPLRLDELLGVRLPALHVGDDLVGRVVALRAVALDLPG